MKRGRNLFEFSRCGWFGMGVGGGEFRALEGVRFGSGLVGLMGKME